MSSTWVCVFCKRSDFKGQQGLTQHQRNNSSCKKKYLARFGSLNGDQIAHSFLQVTAIKVAKQPKIARKIARNVDALASYYDNNATNLEGNLARTADLATNDDFVLYDSGSVNNTSSDSGSSEDSENSSQNSQNSDNDSLSEDEQAVVPNHEIRDTFRKYFQSTSQMHAFTANQIKAIQLLAELRRTRAPLNTYETVMTWHFRSCGEIENHQPVSACRTFISRPKLFKFLQNRYSLGHESSLKTNITVLPHSRARAKIVTTDIKLAITSLLTDPRITDDDYLFHQNDPFGAPPNNLNYVGDLNTGKAYTDTYKRLIPPNSNKVLLPVIFYIDAANTGQFVDLPITAVQLTLGIFKRKTRDKAYMWRTIGYIPSVSKYKSRGRRLLIDSQHVDSVMTYQDALQEEGLTSNKNVSKAQDLHAILAVILEDYIKLQKSGFLWDLPYNNVVHNIHFVLFTPFFKVDGDEAEKLCGKFTSRTNNVKCLCRYCQCPTELSDRTDMTFRPKTPRLIEQYRINKQDKKLKKLSQHNIINALYPIRFGLHNNHGVHGACPMEMLHAINLGIFKYTRDCFFDQIGATSALAVTINSLGREYGSMLSRQSDRNFPNTKFAQGVQKGKIMAKEFPGVLLCLAAALASTSGKSLLSKKRRQLFGNGELIKNWIILLELLLKWEMWLKKDVMEVNHVRRAQRKHRYLMHLIKLVANRTAGMGHKVPKFHGILHMADDIINFGVPSEYDTGSNEAAHKPTKVAARVTQKCEDTFDLQTATRLEEMHLLTLAELETQGKAIWNYYDESRCWGGGNLFHGDEDDTDLGGTKLQLKYNYVSSNYEAVYVQRGGQTNASVETDFVNFLTGLHHKLKDIAPKWCVRSIYRRKNIIFRSSPLFQGHVWRDWVKIDWGEEGVLCNKIWGFIDLSVLNMEMYGQIHYGGIELENIVYAIVETSTYEDATPDHWHSTIFSPINTEISGIANSRVAKLKFYLADVEAFVEPVAVIPDIGGPPNRYFVVKSRACWEEDFEQWLEKDHEDYEEIVDDASNDRCHSSTDSDESGTDDSTDASEQEDNSCSGGNGSSAGEGSSCSEGS